MKLKLVFPLCGFTVLPVIIYYNDVFTKDRRARDDSMTRDSS